MACRYDEVTNALAEATAQRDCVVVRIQGAGKFYSSTSWCCVVLRVTAPAAVGVLWCDDVLTGRDCAGGNDLSNFADVPPEGPQRMAEDAAVVLERFVNAFIDCPKPIIAAVNGPAIGIAGESPFAAQPVCVWLCACGCVRVCVSMTISPVHCNVDTQPWPTPTTSTVQRWLRPPLDSTTRHSALATS